MERLLALTETAIRTTNDLRNYTQEDIDYGIKKLTMILEEMHDIIERESPGLRQRTHG